MRHDTRHANRWPASTITAALLTLGLGLGVPGCSADREVVRKEVRAELDSRLEQKIRDEVDRRLKAELPLLEERLVAKCSGGKLPAGPKGPSRVEPGEAGEPRAAAPTGDAARDRPAPSAADAGAARAVVSGPPAVPPDAMEARAPDVDPQGLVVNRVLLAKNLVERKPEGEGTAFTLADPRIYCYIDAKNPKGPERKLTVVWHHNGKVFHRLGLRVGVGHVWRTWAFLTVRPGHEGNWRCGVLNEEGQLIRGVEFTIAK